MSIAIYKPGQGYWTRTMSAVGLGVLVIMGAYWLANQFSNVRIAGYDPMYTRATVFTIVVACFAAVGYYLIAVKPRMVEFLIATEGEMKKVNWSNRKEIMGSTWVVIGVTMALAVLCFAFDFIFQVLFKTIGVLKTVVDAAPPV
jgi:preprotein translocase SecE subunit